ncbi:MAG: hypothetical protein ACPL7C_11015 [Anaerolineae bacterium]
MSHQQYSNRHTRGEGEIQCVSTYHLEIPWQRETDGSQGRTHDQRIHLYGVYAGRLLSDPKSQIEIPGPDFYDDVV